jgi:AmmeMemoRadiSam system protein A
MPFELTVNEKKFLLQLARQTILDYFEGLESRQQAYFSKNLKAQTGAFVTLTLDNELRGCIGYVDPLLPLQDTVAEMAVSAAFNDPRFPSLNREEFQFTEIEISVLTPKEKIKDISAIRIGRDGLVVKKGFREGLLLPQVASAYNGDTLTVLEQTCRKAGLTSQAWKDSDTEILRFSALIFGESDFTREELEP